MISIIIPLYNKEESIIRTIDSVLKQDCDSYEIIVVDDGSIDRSLEVVSTYKDPRIRVFSKENGGVSTARNHGAQQAKGDWLFFLDADDLLEKSCIKNYTQLTIDYPTIQFFTSNFISQDANGAQSSFCYGTKKGLVKKSFKSFWQREISPRTGAMLVHVDLYNKIGGFRNESLLWEDLEIVLSLLVESPVVYDPTPSFVYVLENNVLSQKIFPIKKVFAYTIDLSKDINVYHKLILLELLTRIKRIRERVSDTEAVEIITEKLGSNKSLLFLGRVERYCYKIRKKSQATIR